MLPSTRCGALSSPPAELLKSFYICQVLLYCGSHTRGAGVYTESKAGSCPWGSSGHRCLRVSLLCLFHVPVAPRSPQTSQLRAPAAEALEVRQGTYKQLPAALALWAAGDTEVYGVWSEGEGPPGLPVSLGKRWGRS